MIIAIDGPAASGKGTLAKRIAAHYGIPCLDTGTLYRAVARDMLAAGYDLGDAETAARMARNLDAESLDDPFLREKGLGEAASVVAQHGSVRQALLEYQRWFAHRPGGAVIDGRDIGTVVCPDAQVKIFVTASLEERARRRYHQWRSQGFEVREPEVFEEIRGRDARDSTRSASPLKRAEDARLLDTSELDIEAAFKAAVELIDGIVDR